MSGDGEDKEMIISGTQLFNDDRLRLLTRALNQRGYIPTTDYDNEILSLMPQGYTRGVQVHFVDREGNADIIKFGYRYDRFYETVEPWDEVSVGAVACLVIAALVQE